MSNQLNILSQLYYTNEPIIGRVLRTNQSYNIGDVVFQENPIMISHANRDLTSSFKSYMYKYSEKLFKRSVEHIFFSEGLSDRVVSIMLAYLKLSKDKRSDIMNHFFYNPQFDDIELRNKMFDNFNDIYNEIKRQLNSNFSNEKENYNCDVNDIQELVNIYDIFRLNAVLSGNSNSALYVNFTLMKHSCKPNIITNDESNNVKKIIAIELIKPGDAITFYYTRLDLILHPTTIRRQHLFRIKQFWCHCELCTADDLTSPLKCPTNGCGGYMYYSMGRFSINYYTGWLCRHCQSKFEGCLLDESNINNLIPIIRQEYELLKQYLGLYFSQYPNKVIQPCSSITEAEQKADVIKGIVGENHSLYILYFRSYLNGVPNNVHGAVAPLRSLLVAVKWIDKTLTNDEYRIIFGLKLLFPELNTIVEVLWDLYQTLNVTSTIIEIIHIFQKHFQSNHRLKFMINEHINQIDLWLLKCCSNCGKLNNNFMKCSGCLKVCYCNKDCQKKDWKRHKTHCQSKADKV